MQPPSAQSLTVSYRQTPSGAWATRVLSSIAPGCFQFSLAGLGGDYEYRIASYNGANGTGSLLSEARGTFNPAGPASALTSLTNIPDNVTFNNQPASSATMDLTYSVNGGPGTTVTLGWDASRQQFNWNASAVVPDPMKSYLVTYSFKVKDKNGAIVNAGSNGQLRLGFDAGEVAAYTPDQQPPTVTFSPPNVPNATRMALQYRIAGSTGPYTPVMLVRDGNGNFVWNITGLRPATGALNLEYAYTLWDANWYKVAGSNGFSIDEGTLTINADGSSNTWRLAWTVTGLNNKSTNNPQDAIHRSQAYDAFGEIVAETDGRGNTTTLAYDANGHLIRKTAPQTHATQEDGTVVAVTPTTNYYYGASGLLAGVQDANGNLNTQTRLAGFGTAGNSSDSRYATTQFEAGGGKKTFGYDIFGEVITQTDELGRVTTNTYDQAGRLIKVSRPGGDTDSYTYDTQGERISHTNALNRRETTDYDAEGRVIGTTSFGGQRTRYTYSYDSTITGAGGRVAGGWVRVTNVIDNADGTVARSASDTTNYFGQLTAHTDYGGHVFSYGYNYAAELVRQSSTSGQYITFDYYANGYLEDTVDHALNVRSEYEYDKEGNRTRETHESADSTNRVYYQMADITYDELNRVAEVDSPGVKINYEYDANGNRRRVLSSYTDINGAPQVQDYWYRYDSQNRFVLTMGAKGMGLGAGGVAISYDAAGERTGAAYADGHTESYAYNADGYLTDVYISQDGKDANKVLRAHRVSDALGRVTEYFEYAGDGKTITKDETSVFDDDNRATKDTQVLASAGQQSHTVTLTYDYRLDDGHGHYTGVDQGVVTHTQQHDTASPSVIDTATSYVWWDQAEQSKIQVRGSDPTNPEAWRWGTGMSEFRYDVNGHLQQVIAHGTDYQGRLSTDISADRAITYINDAHGQVLQRDDVGLGGGLTVTERYYYLDGNRIGDVSNNGPATVSYAEELAQADRLKAFGQFRYGHVVTSADFDQNYEPINAEYPGKSPLRYTVHDGDTLSTIARALWGDASLWYLIADANGLTSDNHLSAGQVLSIPNKVTNFHNSASTFKVYNPGEAIGDAMPTLPPEPLPPPPPMPDGACGGFGMVIAMVVAVVVTVYTEGLASPYMSPLLAGATAGAAGAAASQGVLIASGDQHGFQWSGVAIGAIGGAVGAEVGEYAPALKGADDFTSFARGAGQAALSNAISQGVDVATGLQHHFDWRGVAASAIAGGVDSEVGQTSIGKTPVLGNIVRGVASQTAGAVVLGGSMRDRLPGMIGAIAGNTVGSEIEQQLQSNSTSTLGNQTNVWQPGDAVTYGPTGNGAAMPVPMSAWSGDDSDKLDLNAAAFRSGSDGLRTGAAASGVDAGTGYSFYPVGPDGIVHMPTIAVTPLGGPPSTEDPELIASQQAAGMIAGLGVSAFKAVNAGVNLVADSVLLGANQLSFGLLQNTSLVQEANQQMGGLADALLHPWNTAQAMWQNEAGLASAAGSRLAAGDNFGAGLAAGEVVGDVAQLAVPALDAGKVGLVTAGRWLAPVAGDAVESYLQRTGGMLSAMPRGEGMSAVLADSAAESVGNVGTVADAAAADKSYGVAFFGDSNLGYYTRNGATIGRTGKSFFMMPLEDSAMVKDAADAALYTGRAPSAEYAYLNGGDIYGLSFPTDGMSIRQPTAADAGGWPHFLEGGNTAVRLSDGPNAGYLVNPTREFVIPGGNQVPSGSVLFQLGPDGEWIPMKRF